MYNKINLNFNFNLNSQALPEDNFDLEQSEQMYAEDSGNILEALSFSVQPDVHPDIPALNLPDKVSKPHDQLKLDFGSLDFSRFTINMKLAMLSWLFGPMVLIRIKTLLWRMKSPSRNNSCENIETY